MHISYLFQNKLPNSHSLPQSVPFLWITMHMAVQDRITWFSLLPFHSPCGPSYQQTLPSLPLGDVSSPTTLSLFHPITQATLLSYLCHPKSVLNPPADHSPVHPPVLSASQPPARSSKLRGFSHSPCLGHLNSFPAHLQEKPSSSCCLPGPTWSGLLSAFFRRHAPHCLFTTLVFF